MSKSSPSKRTLSILEKEGISVTLKTNSKHVRYAASDKTNFEKIVENLLCLLEKVKAMSGKYVFFLHDISDAQLRDKSFTVERRGENNIKINFWIPEGCDKFAVNLGVGQRDINILNYIFTNLKNLQNGKFKNPKDVECTENEAATVMSLESAPLAPSDKDKDSLSLTLDELLGMDILDAVRGMKNMSKTSESYIFYRLLTQEVAAKNLNPSKNKMVKGSVLARNKDRKLKYEKLFDDFCVRFSIPFEEENRCYIFYNQAREFLEDPDHFDRSLLENKLELLVKDIKVQMVKDVGNKKNVWSKKTEKTFQDVLYIPFLKDRADDFRGLFFRDDYRDLMEAQVSKDAEAKSELKSLKEKLEGAKNSLAAQSLEVSVLKKVFQESAKKEVKIKKGMSEMLIKIAEIEKQLN